jgi:DNA/RNA endonuclease YhcR with UshA esterase domain
VTTGPPLGVAMPRSRSSTWPARLVAGCLAAAFAGGTLRGEGTGTDTAAPPTIAARDAAEHVGEECAVEMVVRAARALADKRMCFLNSSRDRDASGNFTVVIFKEGLARFRDAGIHNPALHFLDRTIRVRGVVASYKGRAQIVVDDPDQIELVDAADQESSGQPRD